MAKKTAYVTKECYHCGEPIAEVDLVQKDFPVHTVVKNKDKNIYNPYVTRDLHYYCAHELAVKMNMQEEIDKEEQDFRKCYGKFCEWYEISTTLDKYTISRLRGMRVGAFSSRGKNTRSVKKGYPYESIYLTMLYVDADVTKALGGINFNDTRHKTNYIMKILDSNIAFVQSKVNARERHERHVEDIEMPSVETPRAEYVNKRDVELELVNQTLKQNQEETVIDFEDLFS